MPAPVTFSLDADGVGWIVFDQPDAAANVFNAATQAALAASVAAAASSGARAIVVRSAKERIFIAGADLKWLGSLANADAAAAFSRAGQQLFQQLADLRVPVVCAIHGACAGGGYELALACHWRIASEAPVTQIGLPEVDLGTIPGWGGCTRLPRLIGATPALDHILRARLLSARDALKAGLVDEVVPPVRLHDAARGAALRLAGSPHPFARPKPALPAPGTLEPLRRATLARTRGHLPAAPAVIDVVEQTATLDVPAALELEARAFGRVTASEACRHLVEVFFLRQAARKRTLAGWFSSPPTGPLPPIRRIGVVGAGVMGSGIAQSLAVAGHEVVLRDVQPAQLDRGLLVARKLCDDAVRLGRITLDAAHAAFSRIQPTTGWEGFEGCDLVIEAIVEDRTAKQLLFTELARRVRPDALLVSNTSALPIEDLAGGVPNPERTLGVHFFNPVSRMPLVELVLGRATSAEAAARVLALVLSLGKSPIIARSAPGFLVTRVLFFYLNAAVKLWESGVPVSVLDEALRDFGWPMGPLRLIDEVGLDVSQAIFEEMAHYYPARFAPARGCQLLLSAGLKGRKNGTAAGFYRYEDGHERVNDAAPRAPANQVDPTLMVPAAISAHLMGIMIDEARRCLAEGVVQSADDIDFALLAGTGFPAFRGGLMRYARSLERPS